MDQLPAWATALISLVVPAMAFGGFWLRIGSRLTASESTAQGASILAAALQIKCELTQRELADYKVEAAEKFVSNKELFHTEERFRGLVEEIKRDIRGVTERLDRVLEGQAKR